MLAEPLNNAWNASRRSGGAIDTVMRFADEGLVLGAGTILVKSGAGGDVSVDPGEPRLHALLAAAHLRRPSAGSLAHLRKAAQRWSEGEEALAAMHLAFSRLDRLERPEADAHRLFLADGLLKAGFEAKAVVDAVEGGDPAFNRLQRYSADQPRVPAGSGRTSGEWTSGDAGSSVGTSPQPEVNPSTITQTATHSIAHTQACDLAQIDCIDAAVYASRNDAANDNARFIDIKNCKEAGLACDALSWATEDLPLPLSGGVIFPHGGVVLIDKGQLDRYLPPLPGGRRPPIRRSLESAGVTSQRGPLKADSYSYPPWTGSPDETVSSDSIGFSACRRAIQALSSKMNGKITDETCSQSKQWGKIIRAKIAYEREGSPGTACVICWSGSGPGVQIAVTLNGC